MGRLIRAFDWESTPMGHPAQWPQSLRTIISAILHSKFPMFLWWGKDLIQFYNDAYRPSLGNQGKHPGALGQKGHDCWPEIWPTIGPMIEGIFAGGEATWSEDQLVPIFRNGCLENVYWTFGYSPVHGEAGTVEGTLVVCTETTGKVESLRKLEASERNLRQLILHAPVGMCILKGPNFILEISNDRMFEIWGKKEGMLGEPLFDTLPEARGQGFEALLLKVFTTGKTYTAFGQPTILPRKGILETVYLNFVYEAYRETDGQISGVIAVAIDVTEQALATLRIAESEARLQVRIQDRTAELLKKNRELERSNAQLEEFAHAASHDLKEPIRKMQFFIDLLQVQLGETITSQHRDTFQRIQKSGQRMTTLVNDLLLYSHVSEQPIQSETIDLNDKLVRVLEDLELDIAERQAIISVGPLPVIQGYRRQLQQLFQNLISNALKYSDPNRIPTISITSRIVAAADHQIVLPRDAISLNCHLIEITDNGIGFEQHHAQRIFQIFQRLHSASDYPGTGLGLSIARKVVENHYGHIRALSEPGVGTTFQIFFPELMKPAPL
ncbi:MAG: ATP-binding protein [Flavitalea sp.]